MHTTPISIFLEMYMTAAQSFSLTFLNSGILQDFSEADPSSKD